MDYVAIPVSTLRGDQRIKFDLYVLIAGRYVLYLRRGERFDAKRLLRLKDKNVKFLYISAIEDNSYREYLDINLAMAFDPSLGIDIKVRADIVYGLLKNSVEEVFEDLKSGDKYKEAKEATEKYVQFLLGEDGAFKEMLSIDSDDNCLAHHSISVSTTSVILATRLGTVEEALYPYLALGALLHDLGHHYSGLNINRPLEQLSPEEMEIYKRHPLLGARARQDNIPFDPRVINIITQHHERSSGTGFPDKLPEKKIDPLALIVGVCDCFDRLVTYEGLDRAAAIKHLRIEGIGGFPLPMVKAACRFFNELETQPTA